MSELMNQSRVEIPSQDQGAIIGSPRWWFDGTDLHGWPAYRIARRGMVRTFQLTKSLGLLSVLFFGGGPFIFIFLLLMAFNAWRRMSGGGMRLPQPSGWTPSYGDSRPMGVPSGFGVGQATAAPA